MPLVAGGKINGRPGKYERQWHRGWHQWKSGVVPEAARMAVARVKQNIWQESWVGAMATVGDPLWRSGSWLAGADFTYSTSRFRGSKNLRIGGWGLATGRANLGSDSTAHGFQVDYPNDLWDINFTYERIGHNFDPSLRFVPRQSVRLINMQANNRTRLARGPIQQMTHQFMPFVATDLSGVYNHNVRSLLDRWQLESNQLLVKLQCAFRY